MVNQDFRIHTEQLVQRIRILHTHASNVAHRVNAAPRIQPAIFQAFRNAAPHLPKTRERPVRPKLPAVTHLVQFRDAHAIGIGVHMLRHHVHRNLAKVQVRADSTRRRNSRSRENILDNRLHQFAGRLLIKFQIPRQVQKTFVDGIRVNILGAHILQVNIVDLRGIFHVLRHLRLRDRELNLFACTPLYIAHLLVHLEKSRTPRNPVGLERGRHRQANRLLGAAFVGHHQLRLKRVKPPEDTFHRGKERLEVYGCISAGRHKGKYN